MAMRRLEQVLALVEQRGFVSVKQLSEACGVSEVTIRRDLETLEREGRLRRTYGGAVAATAPGEQMLAAENDTLPVGIVTDRADVLVVTTVEARFDRILLERAAQRRVPIIAESLSTGGPNETVVAVDNYQAAAELGRWVSGYVREHFGGHTGILDLSYHLSNTRERSRGFVAGLQGALPDAQLILSIDAGSSARPAYQITADALAVHPEINVIFAINDATATGAMEACQDQGLDPEKILLVPFGLEGPTLRHALLAGRYCRAGLAMFPEIVGPVCVEAAIAAFNGRPLPARLITPYAILTAENLLDFYAEPAMGCDIRWETVLERLHIPLEIRPRWPVENHRDRGRLPACIGFAVPFMEHEWYRTMIRCMKEYAGPLDIEIASVDAAQLSRDDLTQRQRSIAALAANQVMPGDVVLLDGDPLTFGLAEMLAGRSDVTVISNSLQVCDVLRRTPGPTLISIGGLITPGADALTGPMAEAVLRELRADKLFLTVTGITLNFGLSHANLSEVAVKQAMIRAAREVILLADHTRFGAEAVGQVASLNAVHKLITDNALPAGTRLELSKLGIAVLIAKT
jgi:DeoR/GlpR family transcriptional regulator of sugar metabolism/ABC-type sugar transport system substrate-binding protein